MALDDPITDKQSGMIAFLMRTRNPSNLPEVQEKFLRVQSNWGRMNRQQASNAIAALQLCDVLAAQNAQLSSAPVEVVNVDEGRYWIVDPHDGAEKFIHVEKPEDGKWQGYTFVKVRASDNLFPVRDKSHREAILGEIAKEPIESMRQYGLKLGVCGCCGRTLTKEISRTIGFGPICCEKLGIPYGIDGVEFTDEEVANLLEEE